MVSQVRNVVLLGGVLLASVSALGDEQLVAQTFSKAAIYILNTDFLHTPVAGTFTQDELAVLMEHREELSAMIQRAFGGAAQLTAHFKLEENIPTLGGQLFVPVTGYGWEGPDYDSEEDYLTDNQFVYHYVYLRAIEETTGRPIHEVIQPTEREMRELLLYLDSPSSSTYYWAKWLARKLRILEPAQ